ncbi:MAG TPA: response regulator [Candidatus Paceibacterota bacterium]|nr:response regulator [Candidatus Paceibacterota bacterium]
MKHATAENRNQIGESESFDPIRRSKIVGKAKILIVDDNVPLTKLLVSLLARAGCEVQAVHTGKEGVQLAQETRFDLIALDIDLPDGDGYQVCREIKQRHFSRHTPIVFMSGRPLEKDIQRGLESGAVDYITKPFGIEFAPRLLSHIKSNKEDEPITKNAESDRAKVLHDIADTVP